MKIFIAIALILSVFFGVGGCAAPSSVEQTNGSENETSASSPTEEIAEEQVGSVLPGADTDSVTEEQRAFYFDFARTYRIDYLPEFQSGETLYARDLKWYAAMLYPDEKIVTDEGSSVTKSTLQKAAVYFDSVDLSAVDQSVKLETGSYGGAPLMELLSYRADSVGEKQVITIELIGHYFYDLDSAEAKEQEMVEFFYDPSLTYSKNCNIAWQLMQAENLTLFEAAKELIICGRGAESERPETIFRVRYETEDGITPTRFVSNIRGYWDENINSYVYR